MKCPTDPENKNIFFTYLLLKNKFLFELRKERERAKKTMKTAVNKRFLTDFEFYMQKG
jgi:hypothetical protein